MSALRESSALNANSVQNYTVRQYSAVYQMENEVEVPLMARNATS